MIRRINPSANFDAWNVKLPEKQADEFRARLWSRDGLLDFAASFLLRRAPDPPAETSVRQRRSSSRRITSTRACSTLSRETVRSCA